MDSLNNANIPFDEHTCELFARVIQQELLNVKVLFFIIQCVKQGQQVTVKSITDNVITQRRKGIKDQENNLVGFSIIEGHIDRKTAEKVVDRLAYTTLINFEIKLPHKFIKLTTRGAQVAMKIHNQIGENLL